MDGVYRRADMNADDAAATGLVAAWPPFGIRIQTDRLTLRLPAEHEIPAFIELGRAGIHPPDVPIEDD